MYYLKVAKGVSNYKMFDSLVGLSYIYGGSRIRAVSTPQARAPLSTGAGGFYESSSSEQLFGKITECYTVR